MEGKQADALLAGDSGDGDEIPGIAGEDIGGEEIGIAQGVSALAASAAAEGDAIRAAAESGDGLDLNTAKEPG